MCRWIGVALPALAVLSLAAGVCKAQSEAENPPASVGSSHSSEKANSSWNILPSLNPVNWFGSGQKEAEKPKEPDTKNVPASRPLTPSEQAALRLAEERAKWQKRIAVCDKLKMIALQSNDPVFREKLLRIAVQLDEHAWNLYQQSAGDLAAGSSANLDNKILAERLGRTQETEDASVLTNELGPTNGRIAARRDQE